MGPRMASTRRPRPRQRRARAAARAPMRSRPELPGGRRLRISRWQALIPLLALLTLLAGSAAGADGAVFRLRVNADPVTFDWHIGSGYSTRFVFTNIMDGLVALDAKLAPVPRLAKAIDVSPDGLTYAFTLREGVK